MKVLKSGVTCGMLAVGLLVLNPGPAQAQTYRLNVALTATFQSYTTNITGGQLTMPPNVYKINNYTLQAVATNLAHVLYFPAGSYLALVNSPTVPFVAWVDRFGTNILANLSTNMAIFPALWTTNTLSNTNGLSLYSGVSYTNGVRPTSRWWWMWTRSLYSGVSYTNGVTSFSFSSDTEVLFGNVPNPGDESTLRGIMNGAYTTGKFGSAGPGWQVIAESYSGLVAGSGIIGLSNAVISGTITVSGSGKMPNRQ